MTKEEIDDLARRAGLQPRKMKFEVAFHKQGAFTLAYVTNADATVAGVGVARRNPKDKIDLPVHGNRMALRRAFDFIRWERIEELYYA
jgi:hypothetical protein